MPGLSLLTDLTSLIAQADVAGKPSNRLLMLVQFGPVLLLAFFFFFWMPMRDRKRRMMMIDALKKNDRVLVEAGIYGTVVSVDEKQDRMVLRIDDDKGVKLTCRKSSVVTVIEPESATDKEKKASA